MKLCLVDDCDNEHSAKGYCDKHYWKWKTYGDPKASAPKLTPDYCTIDGCTASYSAKGLCAKHYRRKAETGSPFLKPRHTPEQRFLAKVEEQATGCWMWTATKLHDGYGVFNASGTNWRAHRWAYEHWREPIPEGLVIDHLCIQRACVNPMHLEPVTAEENMRRARYELCMRGHRFTPENTYYFNRRKADGSPTVVRTCRRCFRDGANRRRRAASEARRESVGSVVGT